MSRILVIHHSRNGQAARIASRIARVLEASGHRAEVLPATAPSLAADIADSDWVLLGAGIRVGSHGADFERTIRDNLVALAAKPTALFSVSMAMAGPEPRVDEAERYVKKLLDRTGWKPDRTVLFAGALRYTEYNPWIRWIMRRIAAAAGHAVDTTRDHEYTDWAAVDRFAREIAAQATPRAAA